jgi:DNA-binding NarL/FixJ family response regulator
MNPSAPDSQPDPRVRVLIVDDTPGVRLLLRIALESDGRFLVVDEAADGAEAIEAARVHKPDVVLLDMGMPVMDGLQALPQIIVQCPGVIVVALSGFAAERLSQEALQLGATAYLEKGIPADALASCLLDLVSAAA